MVGYCGILSQWLKRKNRHIRPDFKIGTYLVFLAKKKKKKKTE